MGVFFTFIVGCSDVNSLLEDLQNTDKRISEKEARCREWGIIE